MFQIESHKLEFRDKAQSKIGSKDNIKHQPGGGDKVVRIHAFCLFLFFFCFAVTKSPQNVDLSQHIKNKTCLTIQSLERGMFPPHESDKIRLLFVVSFDLIFSDCKYQVLYLKENDCNSCLIYDLKFGGKSKLTWPSGWHVRLLSGQQEMECHSLLPKLAIHHLYSVHPYWWKKQV